MKKSMFRDLPAVRNKNRPEGREPVTYVWVGKWPLIVFRRAW